MLGLNNMTIDIDIAVIHNLPVPVQGMNMSISKPDVLDTEQPCTKPQPIDGPGSNHCHFSTLLFPH